MATNTYVALDKITLGSDTPTVTFTSIPSTYTDLVLVMSVRTVNTNAAIYCQFNSDTGTNYSNTQLLGNGSIANSGRQSSVDKMRIGNYSPSATNTFGVLIANFQNYANTTTYKTVISRAGYGDGGLVAEACLWRSTAAISSILIGEEGSGNLRAGSTFSLYGIRAEGVSPAVKATGGAIYSDDTYYYHVFGSTGTFTPLQSLSADVLVVAGGGGGASRAGGGGGAGGVTYYAAQSLSATGYTCTVGAGGAGGGGTSTGGNGSSGVNSQFGSLTASVGGGWGIRWLSAQNVGAAGSGGSGGGATMTANGTTSFAGSNTVGQGFNGGAQGDNAAGGGGAGATGSTSTSTKSGDGGVGTSTYSSWGVATGVGQNVNGTYYLAGGGGGGIASNSNLPGVGGYGGGGNGNNATTTNIPNGNGQVATGGGGGGAGNNGDSSSVYGGNGGSGVVIVRYAKA